MSNHLISLHAILFPNAITADFTVIKQPTNQLITLTNSPTNQLTYTPKFEPKIIFHPHVVTKLEKPRQVNTR